MKVLCIINGVETETMESCTTEDPNGFVNVIFFLIAVSIVGFLAYLGVQSRKKNAMSLFDSRTFAQRSGI